MWKYLQQMPEEAQVVLVPRFLCFAQKISAPGPQCRHFQCPPIVRAKTRRMAALQVSCRTGFGNVQCTVQLFQVCRTTRRGMLAAIFDPESRGRFSSVHLRQSSQAVRRCPQVYSPLTFQSSQMKKNLPSLLMLSRRASLLCSRRYLTIIRSCLQRVPLHPA